MTSARRLALGFFACTSAIAQFAAGAEFADPPAPEPPLQRSRMRSSFELSGTLGPSIVFRDPANPEYTQSFNRIGAFGELGMAYRSSYFVDPFLSVGYATLATGESAIPSGPWGQGGTLEQHLGAWVISPGITADLWRFRPRVGLGLAVIVQSFEFAGSKNASTQLPIVTQLGLGFNALDYDRLRLDFEARVVLATGADVTFTTFGAVLRGDLFHFGSG
jgi:hypothetical protein